jgi:hypothetical protein
MWHIFIEVYVGSAREEQPCKIGPVIQCSPLDRGTNYKVGGKGEDLRAQIKLVEARVSFWIIGGELWVLCWFFLNGNGKTQKRVLVAVDNHLRSNRKSGEFLMSE